MKTPSPSPLTSPSSVSHCLTTPPPPPPADDDAAEPAIAGIAGQQDNEATNHAGPTRAGQDPASAPAARPGLFVEDGAGDGGAVAEKATATPVPPIQQKAKNNTTKTAADTAAAADTSPFPGLLHGLDGTDGLTALPGFYGSHNGSLPAAGTVEDVGGDRDRDRDGDGNGNGDGNGDGDAGGGHASTRAGLGARLAALAVSFVVTARRVLFRTWLNSLLVFVPAGIAVAAVPGCPPAVVFSLNAIAIVPLAGLLGFATEAVAHRMGDSIGALLNITFGNAVELIIFVALVKNEIRIVQASLLGSILANLLLILGMGFLLGGLRFREQIYNSTVTQMSACLLSLSVISLVLPTAFHASFSDNKLADSQSLKISRGTSVVLLLVYGLYLLFQLKSHAYMYESTPQHIIDEEATPGPAAAWLDTSSSTSDDSAASSSSDSDSSDHSRDTMRQRVRRVMRRRHRKSSVASLDTVESFFGGMGRPTRTPSSGAATAVNDEQPVAPGEDAPAPPQQHHSKRSLRHHNRRRHRRRSSNAGSSIHTSHANASVESTILEGRETEAPRALAPTMTTAATAVTMTATTTTAVADGETRHVDFALVGTDATAARRMPLHLRAMALRPVAKSLLAPSVFTQPMGAPSTAVTAAATGPIPRVRYGIRRTNSLPDRLNQQRQVMQAIRPAGAMLPAQIPVRRLAFVSGEHGDSVREAGTGAQTNEPGTVAGSSGGGGGDDDDNGDGDLVLSRKAAVVVLLVTTGLVAACAEFMVDSINGLVATSAVNEVFIGLIILPIVGNAAEHVTAVTVAMKNKMDLAIGVAVGSSIQIALFMTPLVVILGWCMGRAMTLYFTLFETVCLFVSAFIVNFLVLDGRSNYLEGALLCATYVIIGLAAFFYPAEGDVSSWG